MPTFDIWNVYKGPEYVELSKLRELTAGKTLTRPIVVVMDRVPGTNMIRLGSIHPDLSEYERMKEEIGARAQKANMADAAEYVGAQLAMASARGEIKWTTTFATVRTTDQEFIYIFKPHGAYALNKQLLDVLKELDCRTVQITFAGRRENALYESSLDDWFAHGTPYQNPSPPKDSQVALTKNFMKRSDYGKTADHIRQERIELQSERETRRPWRP